MTVFDCKIIIEDKEYSKLLLQYTLVNILQNKIYKEFNLSECNYSLYAITHSIAETKNIETKQITKKHIFGCVLHIFD